MTKIMNDKKVTIMNDKNYERQKGHKGHNYERQKRSQLWMTKGHNYEWHKGHNYEWQKGHN